MTVEQEYIENCFLMVGVGGQSLGDGAARSSTLRFQNTPSELGTSKLANYQPVTILGRANPLWIYSSSGPRSWNLELKFVATGPAVFEDDYVLGDKIVEGATVKAINKSIKNQVADKVNWCEALVYPIYRNNISQGTAKINFVFGDMINTTCICTDVQSSYPGPWYVTSGSNLGWPIQAVVNLTLTQIGGASLSYDDVVNNRHNNPKAI